MMQILRLPDGLALTEGEEIVAGLPRRTVSELLRLSLSELRSALETAPRTAGRRAGVARAPIDGQTEVWAAGVTYRRSEEARVEESGTCSGRCLCKKAHSCG